MANYDGSFTTLLGLFLEVLYVYFAKPRAVISKEQTEQNLAENLNEAGLM